MKAITVKDHIGRQLRVPIYPQRIVSLVPSQTELLHWLGLADRVVGITKFCARPAEWHRDKPHVGGTKDVRVDRLVRLGPDLVLANREENVAEQVDGISRHCPVWVSDVNDIHSALSMIEAVGTLTGTSFKAEALVRGIADAFSSLPVLPPRSVVCLIWDRPIMAAGSGTFIHAMMQAMGLNNLVDQQRYPVLTIETLQSLSPQVLLLPSEPYPYAQRHAQRYAALLPLSRIHLVDGQMLSWYGPRMLESPAYLTDVLDRTC